MLTIRPHAYELATFTGGACDICGCPPEHSAHILALPGFEESDTDRAQARAEAEGLELTARMREPKADVTGKTREIEQRSPLFRDSDANTMGPGLF